MITISVKVTKDENGKDILSPSAPIPTNAVAVQCDGKKYVVYQVGDTVPQG